ncbi:MAG: PAS domain-containing protein [Magnetococcales bacterium]|nr:PAS domain-containing protein [Magnetococcales bacterium]
MSINAFYSYQKAKSHLELRIEASAHKILTLLRKNLSDLILSYAVHEYGRLVDNEMDREGILAVVVEDLKMGSVTGELAYTTGKIRNPFDQVVDFEAENTGHQAWLDASYHKLKEHIIDATGTKIGSITVYISGKRIDQELDEILRNALVNAASMVIFLVFFLSISIYVRLLRPLTDIAHAISNVDKDGIPAHQLPQSGPLEIRLLSATMNRMIVAIRESRDSIRKSKEQLELILWGSGDGSWHWDIPSGVVNFDERWTEMLGYRHDEIDGNYHGWQELIHPDDIEHVMDELTHHLKGKTPDFGTAFRMRTQSGEWKWILGRGKVVKRGADGSPIEMAGTHSDIDDAKKAERNFLQERQRLANILEGTRAGTWEWNVQTGETLLNERWAEIIGYTLEEISPVSLETWLRFTHQEDLQRSNELLKQHFKGAIGYYECEARMHHKNGDWIWILDRGKVISWTEDGQPLWMAGTHSDITRTKKAEAALIAAKEQAEHASRVKGEFLANMSHEIRTPMNAILGMTELLTEHEMDDEARNFVKIAHNAGETLLSIINDILDLSKIEAGQVRIEQITFDLHDLMATSLNMIGLRAKNKNLVLESALATGVPQWVIGDPLRLRQIFLNLLGNALKFTARGKITVLASAHPDHIIELGVQDTGIGIAPERMQGIFESFAQEDASITRRYGGTGLGLTISRRLAELMGGTIRVESEVGKGSTFWITAKLPATAPPIAEKVETQTSALGRPLQILVAEDAEENRMIIEAFLKQTPHRLIFAENGAIAFERFKESVFDLVLMDVQMPVMDGMSAARAIRKWEMEQNRPPTPIVALTAYALKEEISKVIEAGCDAHIAKPVKKKRLLEALVEYAKEV